jgi:hypothetical protein
MAFSTLHTVFKNVLAEDVLTTVTSKNTLVPADPSKRYKITDVTVRAIGGDTGGATLINVQCGTNIAWSAAVANIDENVVNLTNSANVTATYVGAWSPGNTPIAIVRTGNAVSGTTSFDVVVNYIVEGGN